MSALGRKLTRDLLRQKGQFLAVAVVAACGVATLVTMRGTYDALVGTLADYYGHYRFADVFARVERAPVALEREIAAIPGVGAVATRVVREVTLEVPGLPEPATGRLVSIPERRVPMLNDVFLRRGRYIEPGRGDEVLASEAFAEANGLAVGDSVGAVINGRWERLRIVGIALSPEYVYEIRAADVFPDNRRFGILWMGRDALASAFRMEGAWNDVSIALAPGGSEPEVIARLDRLLERYGGLGAYGRQDQVSARFLSDEVKQNRITGLWVPSIFLGVTAFLIHLVLSRLVQTQRGQVAVLKAFGYTNTEIGLHYFQFALATVLAGGVAGTGLGIWMGAGLARMYQTFYRFPLLRYEPGPDVVGISIGITLGAATLGALHAVRSAVRLPPAEAMRPEPPSDFHAGVFERWGLLRALPHAARMIARNILRRKRKAFFSVLGIALAVAVVIVGRFFYDAIERMVVVQFEKVQREDVLLSFNETLPSRARHEVARLPGVLRAEPYRTVFARLRSGHRSRRIGILGLVPGATLRKLVGKDLRTVPLPEEGLVLTRTLGEILGVGPGDILTVEVLEGERPVRQVPVAGLVDELIGLSATMDVRALHRLLGEGETISGAYLAVDPAEEPRLFALLKRTPAVAGVASREAMLGSFRKTIAESLGIFLRFLLFFACVIAAVMVYNGARIALSERGHELATLRVLGFTRREITAILLGEQAVLTALAIPVGFLVGLALSWVLAGAMESELYRVPVVVRPASFAVAFGIVAASSLLSGMAVARRLRRLDLVAVLKTRE